jgi:hypothetical protein
MSTSVYLASKVHVFFLRFIQDESRETAKEYYEGSFTTEEKRTIATFSSFPFIRAYLLIACFLEGSQGETLYAANKSDKGLRNAPDAFFKVEKKLYELALNLVIAAHGDWGLKAPLPPVEKK